MADIGIILQARMGSSRLPGKVLLPLAGRPLIARVVDRLRRAPALGPVILATSTEPGDDALAAWAESTALPCFRGSEADVLDRYYQCASLFGLSRIVRATADNPFVDPEEGERLAALQRSSGAPYACAFPEFGGGLPKGVGLEILTFAALEASWKEGLEPHHREHVNEFVQENPGRFPRAVPEAPPKKRAPELSLTVDTPEDFARAEALYAAFLAERRGDFVPVEWAIMKLKTLRA